MPGTEQRPRGLSGPAPRHRSPGGTQSCPLGRYFQAFFKSGIVFALISLFQLACLTLAPRVGPCLAVSQHRRGAATVQHGYSLPQRRAGSPGTLPHRVGAVARGPAPPLFQASSSAFFLALHLACGPEPEAGGPMGTHSCPVLHCDPFPHPHCGPGGGAGGGAREPAAGSPTHCLPCSIAL